MGVSTLAVCRSSPPLRCRHAAVTVSATVRRATTPRCRCLFGRSLLRVDSCRPRPFLPLHAALERLPAAIPSGARRAAARCCFPERHSSSAWSVGRGDPVGRRRYRTGASLPSPCPLPPALRGRPAAATRLAHPSTARELCVRGDRPVATPSWRRAAGTWTAPVRRMLVAPGSHSVSLYLPVVACWCSMSSRPIPVLCWLLVVAGQPSSSIVLAPCRRHLIAATPWVEWAAWGNHLALALGMPQC